VLGEKEASSGTVNLRKRTGEQASISLEELLSTARGLMTARSLTL
jgi:hypothetical protein